MRRGAGIGTPGPDSGFALRLAHRFEDELELGEGESAHDVLLGVALVASKRAALFGRAPCIYDVPPGAQPVGLPRRRPGRRPGHAAGGVLLHLPRLRGAAGARRRRPRGDAPARARTRSALGAVPRRLSAAHADRRGRNRGDRPARDRGGRLHLHRPRLWPARGAQGPAPARLPADLVGLARRAVGAGPGGVPRRGARPARLLHGRPPGRRWATTPPSTCWTTSSPWPTPWTWRRSTSWATTGAACWPGSWPRAIPAASALSTSCRRRTRSRCRTRCAAPTRPRPPTARPWMPSARPRSPSACCSAPTAGAAAWPRSWRRPVSTTRTPRCMSPP